jgi:hypothetical protein
MSPLIVATPLSNANTAIRLSSTVYIELKEAVLPSVIATRASRRVSSVMLPSTLIHV